MKTERSKLSMDLVSTSSMPSVTNFAIAES